MSVRATPLPAVTFSEHDDHQHDVDPSLFLQLKQPTLVRSILSKIGSRKVAHNIFAKRTPSSILDEDGTESQDAESLGGLSVGFLL